MPCWTSTMIGINTGKPLNLDRMNDALTAAGYRVIGYHSGKATLDYVTPNGLRGTAYADGRIVADSLTAVNQTRQHYTAETIRAASKRFGWKAQAEKSKTTGQLTITLKR